MNLPNQKQNMSPCMIACQQNRHQCLRILLEANGDVNYSDPKGINSLHIACRKGNIRCVKVLIEGKIDPNMNNAKGIAPIYNASFYKNMECVWTCFRTVPGLSWVARRVPRALLGRPQCLPKRSWTRPWAFPTHSRAARRPQADDFDDFSSIAKRF